ncbi:hypothetical protein [Halostella litorea]|uniref:hypothetical protein n=1 Tax=Halostella litorea TaxID=2528831 RepID=UPI001092E96D|nr:hypothetical protein [Halostella litorea]
MSVDAGPAADGQSLAAVVEDLQEQVEGLATELAEERKRREQAEDERDALRERVADLEERPAVEMRGDKKEIGNIWIGGLPMGNMVTNRKREVKELDDRVYDIEIGEIDPGEVVAEAGKGPDPGDLLPIHQMYNTVTELDASDHGVPKRKELAARVFPYFDDYAYSNEGRLVLPSTKVKDIIERELPTRRLKDRLDIVEPHNETVKQVMRWIAEYSDGIIEFDTDEKTNRLVGDRDRWIEYTNDVMDAAHDDGEDSGETAE